LYFSPNIIRVINSRRVIQAGHVTCFGENRGEYMVLIGKPERKRPLEKPTRTWEQNIKMDHK
jgi:hypothetical protein